GLAARLHEALVRPVAVAGRDVTLTMSIGVALHLPGAATTAEELIGAADAAMYCGKARGGRSTHLFDAAVHERATGRIEIENGLRRAAARDELVLHYQAVVDPRSGDIHGVEALVRWDRPGRGLVPPSEFIAIAEESGLIVDLGAWVLERGARDVARWR